MARRKEISITVSRKESDGNYGSYEALVSETVTLEEGDDVEDEVKELRARAIKSCSITLKATKEKFIKTKGNDK